MKKAIVLSVFAIMGAFLFTATAMAYDDLITNDTAMVAPMGSLHGSLSLLYASASKYWDADGNSVDTEKNAKWLRVPLKANFGVMDKLTVFGVLPFLNYNHPNGTKKSGIGDVWLGAKYAVMPGGCFTLRGAVDLPSGKDKDGLGNPGGVGVDVAAMSMYQAGLIGLNGQVGVRWNAEGPKDAGKFAPGIGLYVAGQGDYTFMENCKGIVGFEFKNVGDGQVGGKDADETSTQYLDINAGVSYMPMEKLGLRADLIYTVAGSNEGQWFGVLLKAGYAIK